MFVIFIAQHFTLLLYHLNSLYPDATIIKPVTLNALYTLCFIVLGMADVGERT
jgi:hypothetical protein